MTKNKKIFVLERPELVGYGSIRPLFEDSRKWVITSNNSLPDNLDIYDVLVLNNVNLSMSGINASSSKLNEFIEGGGGCLAIHDSAFIRAGFEPFLESLGVQPAYGGFQLIQQEDNSFVTQVLLVHSDPNNSQSGFVVKPYEANRNHPVVNNISNFNLCDEYWAINIMVDVTPLLIAESGDRLPVHPRLQNPLIVGGIRRVKNGRCAFLILGHFPQTYQNENIQTFIKNSILWLGKRINSSPFDYELFISFSSTNRDKANEIEIEARRKGVRCFLSDKQLKYGDEWDDRIRDGLLKSKEICVLMTSEAIKSEWVTTEWGAAWALGKRITPILIDLNPNKLPKRLQRYQAVKIENIKKYLNQLKKRITKDNI